MLEVVRKDLSTIIEVYNVNVLYLLTSMIVMISDIQNNDAFWKIE